MNGYLHIHIEQFLHKSYWYLEIAPKLFTQTNTASSENISNEMHLHFYRSFENKACESVSSLNNTCQMNLAHENFVHHFFSLGSKACQLVGSTNIACQLNISYNCSVNLFWSLGSKACDSVSSSNSTCEMYEFLGTVIFIFVLTWNKIWGIV